MSAHQRVHRFIRRTNSGCTAILFREKIIAIIITVNCCREKGPPRKLITFLSLTLFLSLGSDEKSRFVRILRCIRESNRLSGIRKTRARTHSVHHPFAASPFYTDVFPPKPFVSRCPRPLSTDFISLK